MTYLGLDADSQARYRVSARSWLCLVFRVLYDVETMWFLPSAFLYEADTMWFLSSAFLYDTDTMWFLSTACFTFPWCRVDSRLKVTDERFCNTNQVISASQEVDISHVDQTVSVIESDRQHTIIIQCPSAQREREKGKWRFCDQCCKVDVKKKSTEKYQESLSSLSQRILFWWTRCPSTSWTKSTTNCSWWNSDASHCV